MQKHMVGCKFFNHKELIHFSCYGNGKVGFKNSLGKNFGSKQEDKLLSALNLVNWLL